MAVVTPLLLALLFGIIEFGWIFMTQETLNHAAREAARIGAMPGATEDEAEERFKQAMGPARFDVEGATHEIKYVPEQGVELQPGEHRVIDVTTQVPYSKISLVGSFFPFLKELTLGSSCSMRCEE
jgi:hypothetical protein